MIAKMHPLLIPPFTNKTLRRAVRDYLAGGDTLAASSASGATTKNATAIRKSSRSFRF